MICSKFAQKIIYMSFKIVFGITIILLIIMISGIGIKILIKKNGKFAGTCASQNPLTNNNDEPCSYCGKPAGEICEN